MTVNGTQPQTSASPQSPEQQFRNELAGDVGGAPENAPMRIPIEHTDEERTFVFDIKTNTDESVKRHLENLDRLATMGIISKDLAEKAKLGGLDPGEEKLVYGSEEILEHVAFLDEMGIDEVAGMNRDEILGLLMEQE